MESSQENEKQILDFWSKNKIYEKSVKKNSSGKKFYFMDGPPYASGHIHMGTALNKILKDIAIRSKRLQGFDVFDRPGYDTHGVPIEFQVEKEIGSKGKQDIEKFGVSKFVGRCKEFATKFINVMNDEFMNLGVWMDWKNPYLTLDDNYMEAIWDAFKSAHKKGLLYLGKYPVHVCTRCGTAVAFNEIEYGKQKDNSIFVKFPLKKKKNTYLIIWTTTPWTLPGNTGVMVNPKIDYQEVEVSNGERWIIAKDLVPKIMTMIERGFTVKNDFKGRKMEGWEYENPLSKDLKLKIKNGYKVILSSRYVTTEEGSGLVHCAPGHGKEDFEVGKEYGLDMPSPVGIDGLLTKEAGKYSGKKARIVDKEIMEDLKKGGYLVYQLEYEHDYPLCWRDKSPLLMISQPQWFFKISGIQKKLLKDNEKTDWQPKWMKSRMKSWLEGISDWPVSRQRYWGTPLPIWVSEDYKEQVVVGSIDELKKLSGVNKFDMHKPGIDKITIKSKSGKVLKRVPEVLDVWFDSGVSSWAALGYPSDKKKFKKYWPADLNIEGKDQVRGWWNSQMILSEIVFGKKPFENITVHGMVLDLGKKKMSKSLGNITSPQEIIGKYGRDPLRYYFAKLSKGEDFSFDEKEMKEIQKVFMVLSNVNRFVEQLPKKKVKLSIEDKWLISRFNSLIKEVTECYNKYRIPEAIQKLENFIVAELSRGYIQMVRERSNETHDVLREVMNGVLKLFAPIAPFITEKIWQELKEKRSVKEESIHLSTWPKFDKKKVDSKLEEEMTVARDLITETLSERDKAGFGLKWPLAKAEMVQKIKLRKEIVELMKRYLNIKKIDFISGKKLSLDISVKIDTKLTPELEAEGFSREIARKFQSLRKKVGLQKENKIVAAVEADKTLLKRLEKHKDFLKERVNANKLEFGKDVNGYTHSSDEKIKGKVIKIGFNVV